MSEKEFEYQEPSNVADFYLKHVKVMEPAKELAEQQSFAIKMNDAECLYSIELLKAVLKDMKLKEAIVIIPWYETNVFEVQRLPDGSNVATFYRFLTTDNKPKADTDACEKIIELCKAYLNNEFNAYTYDNNMTADKIKDKIISYSLIQRKLSSMAVFRNSPEGASKRIKGCLKELSDRGFLRTLSKSEIGKLYNMTAQLYEIVDKPQPPPPLEDE